MKQLSVPTRFLPILSVLFGAVIYCINFEIVTPQNVLKGMLLGLIVSGMVNLADKYLIDKNG